MDKLFEIENLRCSYDKCYQEGTSKVVLEIDKVIIPKGKKVFIVGESGIGKSTILETLGMMNDTIVQDADSKFLFYDNEGSCINLAELWKGGDDVLSSFRLKHFSFIFQGTNLMHNFTAYENIALTRILQGYSMEEAFARATEVLQDLGLGHIDSTRMTQELSGGQQQRVSIARALALRPELLCFDEPTSALDPELTGEILKVIRALADEKMTMIVVTHEMAFARDVSNRVVYMNEGVICEEGTPEEIFGNPKKEETKDFLARFLNT